MCTLHVLLGNLLLSTSQNQEKTSVMVVRPDMFPFHSSLMEAYVSRLVKKCVYTLV